MYVFIYFLFLIYFMNHYDQKVKEPFMKWSTLRQPNRARFASRNFICNNCLILILSNDFEIYGPVSLSLSLSLSFFF